MRLISRSAFREFWEKPLYADSEIPLRDLAFMVERASWKNFSEIRTAASATVSQITSERYVFNVGGNKYRVVLVIKFRFQIAYVRFVGTHAQYDQIDVETV